MTRARWRKLISIIAGWCCFWGLRIASTPPAYRASWFTAIALLSALILPFLWLAIATWRTEDDLSRLGRTRGNARREFRRKRYGAVERRAYALLESHLTPQQRADWRERSVFTVIGSQENRYTLNNSPAFNVISGDSLYCARPESSVPQGDVLLAQKLLLESDEAAFLAVANRERRILPEFR